MPKSNDWTITINSFSGFVPAFFENSYPYYGNKGQASAMVNVDLIDPNVLTQGPGVTDLTDGTQAGAVTTLITSIPKTAVISNNTYAIGGAKLYRISATVVFNAGIWPHTITGTGTITGEDVVHYQGKVLYSYNDDNTPSGNIGSYDLSTTFDHDYWTTALSGDALVDAPHQMIVGGDDVVYITNGRYIATLTDTTPEDQGLDFWQDSEVASLSWNHNRVIAAVNRPNLTGSNFNQSAIYTWDGVSASWESDPIEVSGKIGALYTKNGITFVWWQDGTDTGAYNFGYISGLELVPLKRFKGSLPAYYQICEYKGFLAWVGGAYVYLWGSKDPDVSVRFFQYTAGKHATIGGISSPFGTLLIASNLTTSYSLARVSGYTVTSSYKTKAFRVGGADVISQIDMIKVITEQMSTGAKVDFTLTYDQGKSSTALTQIAYAAANNIEHKIYSGGQQVRDFRLDIDWANGSATNPVKIREITIKGHYVPFV